ncbi:hypothetical protein SH591_09895 [Sphingomonas sp. LY54]|uniref:hypothetical protein n=1 Tax=Sphingomonas sp. LY54 TaxID=3095343 RepID=UPI002D7A116E|nr:hypothetical protein [Sphingomonas sp. LY54]WRP27432.1 hypothetical protein SH591_09895 [Sphingomonas sp. LY54]
MKPIIMLSAVVALLGGCAYDRGPEAAARAEAEMAEDAANLEQALAGRVAEDPQSCVNSRDLAGNKSFGEGAILFRGRTNSTVYVNRPPTGCPDLSYGRALKVRTISTRLCRGDIINVFDPVSGVEYGSCSLGDFTPYRRGR